MNKEHLDYFMKDLEESIYNYLDLRKRSESIENKNYFLGKCVACLDIYNQIAEETNEYDIIEFD